MRKMTFLQKLIAILPIAILVIMAACEGPAGAPGADGKDGKDGTNGTNGTNGINASETCRQCHNSSSILVAKSLQLNHSLHVAGEAWHEGTRNSCAPCHSSEGFLDVIAKNTPKNKYLASAAVLTDPTPLGCRTCHKIHSKFDSTDFALTTVAAVDLMIDTTKALVLDMGNSSNLCIKCHQPRIVKQMDFSGTPSGSYTAITSYRWGTHYGTQGAIYGGKGGFEIAGTEPYTNSSHKIATSCVTCHSPAASGNTGGHSFNIVNEETKALNTLGCAATACHPSASTLTTKINTTKTEIGTLVKQLGDKIGFMEKDGDGNYTGYVDIYDPSANADGMFKFPGNTSSWTQAQKDHNATLTALPTITNVMAAATANFQLVVRDGSLGVHNFPYTKALLTNSIAALP